MAAAHPIGRARRSRPGARAAAAGLYALGAGGLAVEAIVHIQQFVVTFHGVTWIGPLFIANAAACMVTIAGLIPGRTRPVAALAGVAISVVALGGLILSYAVGLFGWMEAGLRAPIAVAVAAEVGAAIALAAALAGSRV